MASGDRLAELDKLYDEAKYDELVKKLRPANNDYSNMDLDSLWRFARGLRFLVLTTGQKDKIKRLAWIKEGLEATKFAAEKFPNEASSNVWHGIFLNHDSSESGTKKRIEQAYVIREYFDKAYKADSKDFTTLHATGTWCYEVSNLGKIERALASAFFASPPTSSFEEALKYFLEAHAVNSSFPMTTCRIAQCYHKIGNAVEAKKYAIEALKLPTNDCETAEAKKECERLAK